MEEEIRAAIEGLQEFNLDFWINNLRECLELSSASENLAATEVLKFFGGFGSLNDMGFSDEDAPKGMSGEQATKRYFSIINRLHRAASRYAT